MTQTSIRELSAPAERKSIAKGRRKIYAGRKLERLCGGRGNVKPFGGNHGLRETAFKRRKGREGKTEKNC